MFVVYKEIKIPGVGGIHPTGIKVGLGQLNGWNLAECEETDIRKFREYDLIPVPKSVAIGMIKSSVVNVGEDNPVDESFVLTDDDKLKIEEAKKFINNLELKIITRAQIAKIKDPEDDLVDLKRLVELVATFASNVWNNKNDQEKAQSKYAQLMNALTDKTYDTNGYMSKDINESVDKINNIINQEKNITDIVSTEYLDKKEK